MATIDVHRKHAIGLDSAKAAVDKIAVSIARQYGVSHRWHGDDLVFERAGIKGKIAVGSADVRVRAELGFMMGALKPTIEREIGRQLEEHLA